jgi:hypothetical protein
MRRLVSCDWENYFRCRPTVETIDFLTGLAYTMPDHWACGNCCKLHAVDQFDFPSGWGSPLCVERARCGPRARGRYNLDHHHIQLALKLSHLGANEPYLKNLLDSHTHDLLEASIIYTAHPKIVKGRFVLFENVVIRNDDGPISRQDIEKGFIMVCPHLALPRSFSPPSHQWLIQWLRPSAALDDITTLALNYPGQEKHGHCIWCPTDYSVIFSKSLKELTFNAWHDFGAYGSALNPYWSSQVWPGQNRQQNRRFDRVLGESRDLYINGPLETVKIKEERRDEKSWLHKIFQRRKD